MILLIVITVSTSTAAIVNGMIMTRTYGVSNGKIGRAHV